MREIFRELAGVLICSSLVVGCGTPPGSRVEGGPAEPSPVPEKSLKKPEIPSVAKPTAPAVRKGTITEVDLNRLLQLQDEGKAYLIDVRPRLFYGLGHLPEAVSMPKKSFPLSLVKTQAGIDAAVAGGKVLVLYCQNVDCPDGYSVGKEMAEMGYSVALYKGGWEEWKEMGF